LGNAGPALARHPEHLRPPASLVSSSSACKKPPESLLHFLQHRISCAYCDIFWTWTMFVSFEKLVGSVMGPYLRASEEMVSLINHFTPVCLFRGCGCSSNTFFPTLSSATSDLDHHALDLLHRASHGDIAVGCLFYIQGKALDHSIQLLWKHANRKSTSNKEDKKEAEQRNKTQAALPSSLFPLDLELRAAKKRLKRRQLKKLVGKLRWLRRVFEQAHRTYESTCRVFSRWFTKRKSIERRPSLKSSLLKLRCSSESFGLGTTGEFQRARHFLTDESRKTLLLWGRVIASVSAYRCAPQSSIVPR
jgi:hypothetical protein